MSTPHDVYRVTMFDRTGPSRFSKTVAASSLAAAEEIAGSRWFGIIERVEFEYEIDAMEGYY